jgi:hypothetical protein
LDNRSQSAVIRDINQPTGLWSKYENDNRWRLAKDLVLFSELAALEILLRKCAHHPNPGEVFLQNGRHLALRLVHGQEPFLDAAKEENHRQDDERKERDRVQRHADVDREYHRDERHQQEDRAPDLDNLRGEKDTDSFDVGRTPLNQVSRIGSVVVRARQATEMIVYPITNRTRDALTRVRGPATAQVLKDPGQRRHGHDNGSRHPQTERRGGSIP